MDNMAYNIGKIFISKEVSFMKRLLLLSWVLLLALSAWGCTLAPSADGSTPGTTASSHSHSFFKWQVIDQATCEADGLRNRSCSCGETQQEVISATGHAWSEADCTNPATCAHCGETDGEALDHSLEYGVCTRCGESFRTKEDVQSILKIVNADIYRIDSAGGVSVDIGWENTSDKTIKYITFEVCAYNAVGDPVRCQIRGEYNRNLQHTGPYGPGEKNYDINEWGRYDSCDYIWDNVWYNDTAETIKIFRVLIQYTDGSEVTLTEEDVEMAYSEMTLSTVVKKIEMGTVSYTIYAKDGQLKVEIAFISDEGYQIRKYGTVKVRLREAKSAGLLQWTYGAVLHEATYDLTDDCYITEYNNEATLCILTGLQNKGQVTFELELVFTFADTQETMTYTAICVARVI